MTPKFLSLEFHTRFFPALLRGRLRRDERMGKGFTSTTEFYILLVICALLVALGTPYAITHRSIPGWIMGGIGIAGILFLLIHSILSDRGNPPSYDRFLIGVFFFFVVLGMSTGVFIGTLNHSLLLGLLIGLGGLLAGYLLGIPAGLWLQHLGWLSGIVNGLAALAAFGMGVVDLVLLAGRLFS